MNWSEIISKQDRVYVETSPYIYFLEESEDYAEMVSELFAYVEQNDIFIYSSVVVLTEVLVKPLATGNKELYRQYQHVLRKSKIVSLTPVTAKIARNAAQLRATYKLRTPDALHIATAIQWECDAFITNDIALKRVTELNVIAFADYL